MSITVKEVLAIDSQESIEDVLRTGLDGFRELLTMRRAACMRDHELSLREWLVLGRWWLDSSGQLAAVEAVTVEQAGAAAVDIRAALVPVVEWQALKILRVHGNFRFSNVVLPTSSDRCTHCARGWTLDNAYDMVVGAYADDGRPKRLEHPRCWALFMHLGLEGVFKKTLEEAGLDLFTMTPIENRYDKRSGSPWFVVATCYGEITIGWRKRVISIEWPKSVTVDWGEEAKQTTNDDGLIHAWGYPKAVEYLKKIDAAMRKAAAG